MSDTAPMKSAAYAQVRVREPLGERIFGESVSVGGKDADVVVPGTEPGFAFTVERRKGVWVVEPSAKTIRFNGRPLAAPDELRRHDTLAVGGAQIVVTGISRTLLRLEVCHLAGNSTIAPAAALATLVLGESGDEDVEIHPLDTLRVPPFAKGAEVSVRPLLGPEGRRHWFIAGAAAAVLAVVAVVAARLEPVSVDVHPTDAHVLTPGTLLAIPNAGHLLLLPGKHTIRAERKGYIAAQTDVMIKSDDTNGVRLRLEKLPGQLGIDTGGVAATVTVDGVDVGRAPGVLSVPAGARTVMISAPRHVDYITNVTIEGAGERQDLKVSLQTSWGSLKVLSIPEGAHVSVDGVEGGVSPLTIAAPSGVRRIRIAAVGFKTWESSVVLKAGDTLSVGPVTLGQPDAHLTVRSDPAGADATVAGTHLGRTPAEIDLPSGIAHQVVLSAPGYKNWTRAVFADPGRKLAVLAKLEPILGRVSFQGDPADAEVVVDGTVRGKAPQSLELPATEHRIEVRKRGFVSFKSIVTPEAGLDHTVQYHLAPARAN